MGAVCSGQRQQPNKADLRAFMDEGDVTFIYNPRDGFRYNDEKLDRESRRFDDEAGPFNAPHSDDDSQYEDSRNMDPLNANSYETDQDDDDDDDGDDIDDDLDFDSTNSQPEKQIEPVQEGASTTKDTSIIPLSILPFNREKAKEEDAKKDFSIGTNQDPSKSRDKHVNLGAVTHILAPLLDRLPISAKEYAEGPARVETPVTPLIRQLFLCNTSVRVRITAKHWARQEEQDCILLPTCVSRAAKDVVEELALSAMVRDAELCLQGRDGEDRQMMAAAYQEREQAFSELRQKRIEELGTVLPNPRNDDDDRPFDWSAERRKYENVLAGFRNPAGGMLLDRSHFYTVKTGFVRRGVSKDVAMEIARARRQEVMDRESDRRVLLRLDAEELRRLAEQEDEDQAAMARMDVYLR